MKKIVFITGSVRSGKSNFAVELIKKSRKQAVFIATCKPADEEMKKRVKRHIRSRPRTWRTVEEGVHLAAVIKKLKKNEAAVVDCLTLWISNLLLAGLSEREISKKVKEFIAALKVTTSLVAIVSNEVGWGIVPDNELSRVFRDVVGLTHQQISKVSDEVYLLVSGIPLKIK